MKEALYYSNNDIRIIEKPIPEINNNEILIKVEAAGICGSDVIEWYRRDKVPLVLGHEVSGTIVKIGDYVEKFKIGDRVVAAHHVPCNICKYCLSGHQTVCDTLRTTNFDPGGFAQYLRLPEINVKNGLYLLPDSVSFEEGTFAEPLACCVRAQRLADIKPAQTVAVIGSGLAGLLHINLLRVSGVTTIIATDINGFRLSAAKKFGADYAINAKENVPETIKDINGGFPADIVIISAGADSAIEQGLKSVRRGGTVLFFSAAGEGAKLPLSINEIFWRTEVCLISSYAGSIIDHINALELIRTKRINVKDMITDVLPLSEISQGFKLTAEAQKSLKIIIKPNKE
jgi:L-iditol 2-dehydrogenase